MGLKTKSPNFCNFIFVFLCFSQISNIHCQNNYENAMIGSSYVVGDVILIVFLTLGASILLCVAIVLFCMYCRPCPLFRDTNTTHRRHDRSRSTSRLHCNIFQRAQGISNSVYSEERVRPPHLSTLCSSQTNVNVPVSGTLTRTNLYGSFQGIFFPIHQHISEHRGTDIGGAGSLYPDLPPPYSSPQMRNAAVEIGPPPSYVTAIRDNGSRSHQNT